LGDPRIHSLQGTGIHLLFRSQSPFAAKSFTDASLTAAGTAKVADQVASPISTGP
jgi:hypothetical protein